MNELSYALPYPSHRVPLLARNVVATSQPLAAQAGMAMLLRGGNAVDAAIATAITLTVVEPTANGVGSDAFAMVWDGTALHGLNGSGRAPAGWTPERFAGLAAIPAVGWESVTVPGAVSTWAALSTRFGKLPFAELLEPAIRYARDGFPVSPTVAGAWSRGASQLADQPGFRETFMPAGRAPMPGEIFTNLHLARTLETIALTRGEAFYRGDLAAALVRDAAAHGAVLGADDLAGHSATWCTPLELDAFGVTLHEMPPNGQGISALIALGLLANTALTELPPDSAEAIHLQIEAMKLSFADLYRYVADPAAMSFGPEAFLDPAYLAERAKLIIPGQAGTPGHGLPRMGGTVYVATADQSGMMVSLIQSNYEGFGSGVVVPETGIHLQNRGAGFSLEAGHPNQVAPGKRPLHTIIPGFLSREGLPLMSFGVVGGPMQPQAHIQLLLRTVLHRQNPQSAIDAPRWRIDEGRKVLVEWSMPDDVVERLSAWGHDVQRQDPDDSFGFGCAQIIHRLEDGYVAGSDNRRDGLALGL